MHFWKQFRAKACSVSLAGATKDDVLRELVTNLVEGGSLAGALSDKAFVALVEREKMATTGVGQNVAIPHVRVPGLTQTAAALSLHRAGLPWGSVDDEPVHLVFTVLRPERAGEHHDPEQHLEMMRWIARLSRSSDFRSFALQARTRTELVDLLKEMSSV
ncbi:MAG: PTS sugar transporter subunit IIA [Planctomycetota bacterium]|nr:PTS sugar transporter subunit IIA [Planctomycetota bacterium]